MRKRPVGVMVIAGYFGVKSAVLAIAALIGYLSPENRPNVVAFLSHFAPSLQQAKQFGFLDVGIAVAPALALFETVKGLGIWFMQKWARSLIVITLMFWFGDAVVAAGLLWSMDRKMFMSIVFGPYFAFGLVVSAAMLLYLLDPDTKRAFGVREGNDEFD